jgi:hypothetical protein
LTRRAARAKKRIKGIFRGTQTVSGVIALAKPRRIKASHRRRRKVAAGHLLYILNNPLSGTDPTGYCTGADSVAQCAQEAGDGGTVNITAASTSAGSKVPQVVGTVKNNGNGTATVTAPNGGTKNVNLTNGGTSGQSTVGSSGRGDQAAQASDKGGQKGGDGKGWLSTAGSAFVDTLAAGPKEYWGQAKALNGDPQAIQHYKDKAEEDQFVSGFVAGVALVDDAREGGPKTAGSLSAGIFVGAVTKRLISIRTGDPWVRNPSSIQDQAALTAAKSGEGVRIFENLGDARFKGMEKWEYRVKSSQGRDSVVHYVRDPKTGKLMDFKFTRRTSDNLGRYERDPNGGIKDD